MLLYDEVSRGKGKDIHYETLPTFKKQIIITCAQAGQAKVIWTKSYPIEKIRQIILVEGKKYMVHFYKNKITDVYLIQKD
jgi:hypothetical protein